MKHWKVKARFLIAVSTAFSVYACGGGVQESDLGGLDLSKMTAANSQRAGEASGRFTVMVNNERATYQYVVRAVDANNVSFSSQVVETTPGLKDAATGDSGLTLKKDSNGNYSDRNVSLSLNATSRQVRILRYFGQTNIINGDTGGNSNPQGQQIGGSLGSDHDHAELDRRYQEILRQCRENPNRGNNVDGAGHSCADLLGSANENQPLQNVPNQGSAGSWESCWDDHDHSADDPADKDFSQYYNSNKPGCPELEGH